MLNSTLPYSLRRIAHLDAALLGRTDLSHAQPIRAYLELAYVGSADLTGAKLSEADLYSASLRGADLDSANLSTDLKGGSSGP